MLRVSSLLALALVLASGIVLSACNTTAGIGKDVSAAGHAVSNTADKVKDKM